MGLVFPLRPLSGGWRIPGGNRLFPGCWRYPDGGRPDGPYARRICKLVSGRHRKAGQCRFCARRYGGLASVGEGALRHAGHAYCNVDYERRDLPRYTTTWRGAWMVLVLALARDLTRVAAVPGGAHIASELADAGTTCAAITRRAD